MLLFILFLFSLLFSLFFLILNLFSFFFSFIMFFSFFSNLCCILSSLFLSSLQTDSKACFWMMMMMMVVTCVCVCVCVCVLQLLHQDTRRKYLYQLQEFLVTDNSRNWRFRSELAEYDPSHFVCGCVCSDECVCLSVSDVCVCVCLSLTRVCVCVSVSDVCVYVCL